MGFVNDVAKRVRGFFAQDKEQAATQIVKGTSGDFPAGARGDLLGAAGYEQLQEYLRLESDLLGRFADYEDMDDYPELSTALDIFADDSTQPNTPLNRTVWVSSKDRTLQNTLDDLYHKRLRMDEEIWEIARTLCKYGNGYEELLLSKEGVVGLSFLPPATVRRVEAEKGRLIGFVQDFKGKFAFNPAEFDSMLKSRFATPGGNAGIAGTGDERQYGAVTPFEGWEVVHFRLRGKHRRSVYGHSVLEAARWIYKRLVLLEDSALIYRLQRAPERFAFYIDVGDLPATEALAYVNRTRQQYKKKKWINPSTGRVDLKFESIAQDEDYFVPSRKGTDSTRIENLGAPQWQHMEDIEYFRDKLFAAVKVPKAYLGQEADVARAVLSSADVRFARTVLRIQRELQNGMRKIGRVHLSALNIDPAAVDYDIHMTVPSAVFELAQTEVRNARADLANRMREFVSMRWLLANVFGMSEEEIKLVQSERSEDAIKEQSDGAKGAAAAQMVMSGIAPEGAEGGDEGAPQPEEVKRMAQALSEGHIGITPGHRRRGISEREMNTGDREAEKRAEAKLEKLLQGDVKLQRKLDEVKTLVTDLRAVSGGRRR